MMEYRCTVIAIDKLQMTNKGPIKPLCDDCATSDCTHCIESKDVSILGTNHTHRVKMGGAVPNFVVACEGFTAK